MFAIVGNHIAERGGLLPLAGTRPMAAASAPSPFGQAHVPVGRHDDVVQNGDPAHLADVA
jgi:hypothetical protein